MFCEKKGRKNLKKRTVFKMLDKKYFATCIGKLSILLQVPVSEKWPELMFEELKDYFTNEEFSKACQQIVKFENCYNKMPTLQQFMKYASRRGAAASPKDYFIKCVMDFIKAPFALQGCHWESSLSKKLSPMEQTILSQLGGLSGLWEQVHRRENPIELSIVQKAISHQYDFNLQGQKTISKEAILLLEDQLKWRVAINHPLEEECQEMIKSCLRGGSDVVMPKKNSDIHTISF